MSRRYGKVSRSSGTTLNEMLMIHKEQVFAWIASKTEMDGVGVEPGGAVAVKKSQGPEEVVVMSLEKPDDTIV